MNDKLRLLKAQIDLTKELIILTEDLIKKSTSNNARLQLKEEIKSYNKTLKKLNETRLELETKNTKPPSKV